jgi:DHA2 family multidrug resistance protein
MADSSTIASHAAVPITPEFDPSHKWLIAIAVMLGATLEMLDSSIVNVSLPHMQGSFSASVDQIAWVLTSYLVANGIMIPMTAWISGRFGRKRYFLTSMALFVVASMLCGAARSLDQIVVFRLFQGFAGAAMIPSSQAILMETFPPNEQQLAMAVWGIGLQLAPVAGPTIGGWITDNLNWRWNFYINIPVGIVAFLMAWTFLKDPPYLSRQRSSKNPVDWAGIVYLAVGLGLLEIVVDRGQRSDWFAAGWVRALSLVSAGALIMMVIRELRFPAAIIDLRIFRIPDFTVAVIMGTGNITALYIVNLLNPLFLQELLGYTAWKAGLLMVPRAIGTLAGMLFIGQLGRKAYDTRPALGVGFLILALGFFMATQWNLQIDSREVTKVTLVQGLGMGIVFPIMSATALSCVPRERMGHAASMYNMVRNTGAAVSLAAATNTLVKQEQVHQSRLVEHLSVFDAWKMGARRPRMPGAPEFNFLPQMGTGQKEALGRVYMMIQAQAAIMSFNDIYRHLAFWMLVLAPFFMLIRRGRVSEAPAGH